MSSTRTTEWVRRLRYNPVLAADARFVFVAVGKIPAVRGARVIWLKTDSAILYAKCTWCGALKKQPCRDEAGDPKTGTHWERRRDASKRLR